MKNFLKLIVLIVTLASFNKHAFSCDSLNVTIGDDFSKVTDILDFIDDYEAENYEEGTTAEYEAHTAIYCPDSGLDNTIIKVFIYQSKIAGIRLETEDPNIEENKIYEYASSVYGAIDDEVKKKNWTGYKMISSGGRIILYQKIKEIDGIYESLDISTEELIDYTVGEFVIRMGE
ncbi:uncharacterized protein METZ01_LOCUS284935 [marine metagenome]|uniref:Uncharacterized protein n=1 Tax=marine metagenome TaxID=408172 RepID=A0A382LB33_9ZZZZ